MPTLGELTTWCKPHCCTPRNQSDYGTQSEVSSYSVGGIVRGVGRYYKGGWEVLVLCGGVEGIHCDIVCARAGGDLGDITTISRKMMSNK